MMIISVGSINASSPSLDEVRLYRGVGEMCSIDRLRLTSRAEASSQTQRSFAVVSLDIKSYMKHESSA